VRRRPAHCIFPVAPAADPISLTAFVRDSLQLAIDALHHTRLLGAAVALSAVLVPLTALALLARWRPPGGRTWSAALRTIGSLAALAYGIHGASLAVAWGHRAVAPARGRVARALGAPVVAALAQYRTEHGGYPPRLAALVPHYLSAAALRAPERSPLSHPFEFSMFGPRYILTVREAPPGHSSCEFASATGRWYCNGYF
jgi:hypothetical protein